MDPFQTLPCPILEMILKLLSDLPSLHSLHNASPAVASLLHEDGVTPVIIEAIISSSGRGQGLPPQTRALFRTVILLQWRPGVATGCADVHAATDNPLPSSWDAFTSPFNQCGRGGRIIPAGYGDARLPTSIPQPILCHVLALATRVRRLTHACLHALIARCMALEPAHPENPSFRYRRKATFSQRQRRPPGRPYRPVDVGAPSWVEEQSVARTVWRLVLFFELRHAAGALGWGAEDVRRLQGLRAEEFWEGLLLRRGELAELKTVAECVFPAGTAPVGAEGGDEGLPRQMVSSSVLGEEWLYCCKESKLETEEEWSNAERRLDQFFRGYSESSPGYFFGTTALANLQSSPLRHVDFAVFRQYGFAIWDLKRMVALGFLESPGREDVAQNPLLSESNLFFTWESILTKDQLEEVEGMQREHW